jgi:copper transport protein
LNSRGRRLRAALVAALVVAITGMALAAGAASAASPGAGGASYPAAGSALAEQPARIVVPAPEGARSGRVTILDSRDKTVATAPARVAGGALVAPLPRLGADEGAYTVVWRAGGEAGSFAYQLDPEGSSPALVQEPQPDDSLNPVEEALPKWIAFAAIMVFIGALALRPLVTGPAIARLAAERRPLLARLTDRRLLFTAAAAIVVFVPATLAELVFETRDEEAGLSFWGAIRPGSIWSEFLSSTPDGHLWLVRLALTALGAIVVLAAAAKALRSGWEPPRRLGSVFAVGIGAGIGELLARVIPTEAPDEWVREIFTDLLDWGHMTAAAIWIGGLVALAILGLTLRLAAAERDGFWPAALRRFSLVATVCVGAMILTGLWTAWIHVGPPRLLFHTLYGETLLVKLILVLILVGLGALNQLWLLPKVNSLRAEGAEGSALAVTLRHFRGVVAVEAVVGLLVLLVVPFLSGSARSQEAARQAADLTQTTTVDGQTVRLRPSGAQPGLTEYDVWVPAGEDRVDVDFSSPDLGVPATEVLATDLGGGHFRATGIYTPIAGDWHVAVTAADTPPAEFDLAVTPKYVEPERPPPPPVRGSTWAWGIAEVLAVLLALGGAGWAGRWITRRRRERVEVAERPA